MTTRSTLLGLAASALLFSAPALAQVSTPEQDAMIPANATYMYNVPYGTSHGSDGQYVHSGTYYNNAPVFTRQGSSGTTWSLYKRANGNWHVDFNAVSEDWDGTVAYTVQAQEWPWTDSTWNNGVISFRTNTVNAQNIPYATSASSAGDYTFSGQIYNSAPVYSRQGGGYTWSLYKRADGKWYVDFNAVSEAWDGTIAYTTSATEWPWTGTWNNSSYLFFRTKTVFMYGVPYANLGSTGAYTFSGQVYNNAPVYTKMVSGSLWSLYKRANGKWHVDFNTVSEDWDGTVAYTNQAQAWPWTGDMGGWANSVISFRTARAMTAGAPYSGNGSAGEYVFTGQIYSNAPVYARTVNGTTWSLYKRANGKWHVDFNTVSEDWDGTVAYTTSAASTPWQGIWNASTIVEDLFAEE
jgi:hypothetical protein